MNRHHEPPAATLAAEYASGLIVREVADRHGMKYARVHHLLAKAGVRFRSRGCGSVPSRNPRRAFAAKLIADPQAHFAAVRERLHKLSIPEPNTGCWIWIGSNCGSSGRPVTTMYGRRKQAAARVSFEVFGGGSPGGKWVLHACDNGSFCINPDHLFLGSPLLNALDRTRKGRYGRASAKRRHIAETRFQSELVAFRQASA